MDVPTDGAEVPAVYAGQINGPRYTSTGLAAAQVRMNQALLAGGSNEAFVTIFETVMWLAVLDRRFATMAA